MYTKASDLKLKTPMGGCPNDGPFWGPYYNNTAPISQKGTQKGAIILTTTPINPLSPRTSTRRPDRSCIQGVAHLPPPHRALAVTHSYPKHPFQRKP